MMSPDKLWRKSPCYHRSRIIIDAFDTQKGVGFEYLGLDNEYNQEPTYIEPTGRTIDHAEPDSAYVLVIPAVTDKDSDIIEPIECFMSWLKSEGILQ